MPQQVTSAVENNFTGGLKTEYTGLNFPENACTDTDNCVFSLIGQVSRRPGIDRELNGAVGTINEAQAAISSYVWSNVDGDGNTKILVRQIGSTLFFQDISGATVTSPTSSLLLGSIALTAFATNANYTQVECQFSSGNGYLFVFSPSVEPLYVAYNAGSIVASAIRVQIRDFIGIATNMPTQFRTTGLTDGLTYDLFNQGWSSNPGWSATSTSTVAAGTGAKIFTVAAGLPIVAGQPVTARYDPIPGFTGSIAISLSGTVNAYVGTTLTLSITSSSGTGTGNQWTINTINSGLINTWATAEGNYPSHADIWWRFKNTSGVFDPAVTQPNVTLGTGPAPKGFYILDAFNQNRSAISGIPNLTAVSTTARPRTGTWFQGRVWYAGADGKQLATGNAFQYTWSETIYFSQTVENLDQFGKCYQNNDPTSEDFFDLLPTDGGTITIQGAGSIFKLFPIQNGLLVHAANGIWFITGSQGIGFTANDYTVTKISAIECISGSTFIDVLGWPIFWNNEGIYQVEPAQQGGGLVVNNLCYGSILTFYESIPLISKLYAKGDYDPVGFVIKWMFRSTVEDNTGGVGNRYSYDRVLNFNTANKAFYPYTIGQSGVFFTDIKYIKYPGGMNKPNSAFKYMYTTVGSQVSLAEERDYTNWVDFVSVFVGGLDYTSYFVTGYKLHGKGIVDYQPIYFRFFSEASSSTAYKIQGIWDYANDPNSGRYSNMQQITNAASRFGFIIRKHKIRGRGLSLQLKVVSVTGLPFHLIGWTSMEAQNTSM